ncbi:MAG: SDR family NAD(P)-dependent oxidoreductase [Lentisphaeria bacterium]|jgi:NAD(P)-dependent dehydrogenase (short-subunit alcohol dehydrogenase family)/rhamnose utilization protein RhaD (predicted bifunctional aldolase and dehydrogenase)|nr:SDR family NAD(P)-dependent oxidoreductase [Lentisphaeria bacterium]
MHWPTFDPSDEPLDVITKISHFYGDGVEFVIAGGGNTSYKNDERVWVKASGASLATVSPEGFVELDRAALAETFLQEFGDDPTAREAQYKDALNAARICPELGQRGSVESLMHHAIPGRYVVHTHSTQMNKLTCSEAGEDMARQLYGEDNIIWIPFVDPGYILSKVIHKALGEYTQATGRDKPRAILLQNHGIIVMADEPDQIREDTDWLLTCLADHIDHSATVISQRPIFMPAEATVSVINLVAPALRLLLAEDGIPKIVKFCDSPVVQEFVCDPDGKTMAGSGPLNPDQIVYCKSFPLWLDIDPAITGNQLTETLRAAIAAHAEKTGFPPKIVLVKDLGLFSVGDDSKAAETTRLMYTDAIKIMLTSRTLGDIHFLSQRDREFIDAWEVEQFRRKVAAAKGLQGRMARRVVVVTGAAQGIGNGIAGALAEEGAHVVLMDVNAEGVAQAAEELALRHGASRAIGVGADVSSSAAMADAIHKAVRTYGGIDLFVSNAGVLRAGSVIDMNPDDFALVADVNYNGYFICVQAVAPIMATQHHASSDCLSDVIQINSKSGLIGSDRNGAYAGSKFGGIGLTQSFALELVTSGIKVNAICPGNFFDGTLWSDPEKGLFVQYLNAGKVAGAKSVEDVRRSYEAKIPMGRGCTMEDVVRGILYLVEQRYETGQALPVTGGQVMLS